MSKKTTVGTFVCALLAGGMLLGGCGSDGSSDGGDAGAGGTAGADAGGGGSATCAAEYSEDVSACTPAEKDYQPRTGHSDTNGWPACVSDDNVFHMIGTDMPAAVSRSVAFESMGQKLWKNSATPTADDFLAARDEYSVDEGLASRVGRRQDVHYPEVPGGDKFACSNEGIPEQYPDRCFAPAHLKPVIDDAFQKGAAGTKPWVQAARIEASLLWFFYLSMTSEVWTCGFDDITDCDSAVGYYTQLTTRDQPKGLGAYVAALAPETHDRVYDALLAERCWRDLDQAMPVADVHKDLYDLAQAQIDKATLRGLALIVRERIGQIGCLTGEAQEAQIEFVKLLGGFLDRGAQEYDATDAATLKAYVTAPTADAAAVTGAQAAIDAIFECP